MASHVRVPASALAATTEARSGANVSTRSRGHTSMANTVVAVADSDRALILREAGHAPVHYFPPEDVAFALLEPTDHTSWCPYKGEADYHSIPAGGERSTNAAWRYREAFPAVAAIAGYVAFYRDRVDISG